MKKIEFYGFNDIWKKIKDLNKFTAISLAGTQLSRLNSQIPLKEIFKSLKELSIENCLLSRWQ